MLKIRFPRGAASRLAFCVMVAASLAACGPESPTPEALSSESGFPPETAPPLSAGNSAPVIEGAPALLGKAGDTYSFTPSATDADGDPLTYSISGLPAWAAFDSTNGTLSGIPNDGHAGQTDDIEIIVSDGTLTDSIGPFRIQIAPRDLPGTPPPSPNTAPAISGTPAGIVMATQPYIFVPTATDADGDRLTFAIANRPSWSTFSTTTGQLSGTPTRSQAGTFSNIRISVTDGRTVVSLAPFQIVVQPLPNSPPMVSGTPGTTATVGAAYSFTPSATDADNNTLTWSIQNRPAWATFNTATGRLSGTPTSTGTFANILIFANDGTAVGALPSFTITVTAAPNRAPSITGTPPTSVVAGSPYSFTASGSDPDPGTTLTYSIANQPAWASFDAATGQLAGTPSTTQVGTYSGIAIRVSDGIATTALPTFSITVTAPSVSNRAPTISGAPATEVTAGSSYLFRAQGTDADGDTLTYSIANAPAWATFNTGNGTLSGTPSEADVGTTSGITITVRDGRGGTATLAAFTIRVNTAAANGFADLAWAAPTTNTDGSQIQNLAGFRVSYGMSASNLDRVATIADPDATSYRVTGLSSGTWHFSVRAYTADGGESGNSNVGSKTIP